MYVFSVDLKTCSKPAWRTTAMTVACTDVSMPKRFHSSAVLFSPPSWKNYEAPYPVGSIFCKLERDRETCLTCTTRCIFQNLALRELCLEDYLEDVSFQGVSCKYWPSPSYVINSPSSFLRDLWLVFLFVSGSPKGWSFCVWSNALFFFRDCALGIQRNMFNTCRRIQFPFSHLLPQIIPSSILYIYVF